jgi:hypothetical protein
MTQHTCPICSETYELPSGSAEGARLLTGTSGMLVLGRGEAPVHRCEQLTDEEAGELLRSAGSFEDPPGDPRS